MVSGQKKPSETQVAVTHISIEALPGAELNAGLLEAACIAFASKETVHFTFNEITYVISPSIIINNLLKQK